MGSTGFFHLPGKPIIFFQKATYVHEYVPPVSSLLNTALGAGSDCQPAGPSQLTEETGHVAVSTWFLVYSLTYVAAFARGPFFFLAVPFEEGFRSQH